LLRHRFFVILSCGAYCSILLPSSWCQKEISGSSSNTENLDFFFFSTEAFCLFSILTVGMRDQRNCSFCIFLLLLSGTMSLLMITKPVRHEKIDVASISTALKIVKKDIKVKDIRQLIYTLRVPLNLSTQKEGKTGTFLPLFNFILICLVLSRA